MSDQTPIWIWVIGLVIAGVAALAMIVLKHILADADHREKTAEALGRLKQQVGDHANEVKSLREGRHEFREQITKLFADLRQEVRDKLDEAVRWVRSFKDRDPD